MNRPQASPSLTRRRLGLLTPYKELPGEYSDVIADASAVQWQVITRAEDSHNLEELRAMGSRQALADGLVRLARWRPDLVMWACTSGSFVFGREGAVEQCRDLSVLAGVPVRSTSLAFISALRARDAREVAILAPYPAPATDALVSFLAAWGIKVCDALHLDHGGATSSEAIIASELLSPLQQLRGGDLVLIPDTATWGFELWRALSQHSERAIITANQATLWLAFDMLGLPTTDPRFGVLQGVPAADPMTLDSDESSRGTAAPVTQEGC